MAAPAHFSDLLSQIARQVTAQKHAEVCCGDLTLEQFQTLRAIEAAPPRSMGSLSATLKVDLSTMSRNVSLLERNGYLTRARRLDDLRVVDVNLTAKGARALAALHCDERTLLAGVYDRLPPGERTLVMRALEILADCLDPDRTPEQPSCCPAPAPPPAPRKTTS